jgi:hypothetical protein
VLVGLDLLCGLLFSDVYHYWIFIVWLCGAFDGIIQRESNDYW